MGGKKKEAQRTKGNVKPASSGRAAQLLEASGGFQTGFVGFDSLSGDLGYVPASSQAPGEAAECGDGELRMVMKRLTKKDAVTKLKALQNFNEICQEREKEVVTDALRYWPRLYSKLAIDHDRRVREAAQEALKQIALRSGREMAPHLKHLIGAWLLSFCDSHAPAASAAKVAFTAVFPTESKQSEAVAYCSSELVRYLSDMLFNSTPQTLSDAKTTTPEEMDEKYERVLSSSLLCLRLVITMCPSQKLNDLTNKYTTVLSTAAFWKYASHKNSTVKAAFYSLLSGVIHSMPELANEKANKICPAALTKFNETDPVVSPSVWESALCTVSYVKEFWSHVNVRKAMLPSLWTSLKKGFEGSASSVAPNLLPLLSKLTMDVTGNEREFYKLLFSHLRAGMAQDKVLRSTSECNAVMRAYVECSRFVISKAIENDDLDMVEELLESQLFSLVEESLLESPVQMSKSCLYHELTGLVLSLQKKMNSSELSARAKEFYGCARDLCWETLKVIAKKCVLADNSYSMSRLIILLKSFILLDQDKTKSTPTRHVGFSNKAAQQTGSMKTQHLSEDHAELGNTIDLTAHVCVTCLRTESEQRNTMYSHVAVLCALCGSHKFYTALAQEMGGRSPAFAIDECRKILSKHNTAWEEVVDIILLITKFVEKDPALNTLIKLIQATEKESVQSLISKVSGCDWLDEVKSSWLAHRAFKDKIEMITSEWAGTFDDPERNDETEITDNLKFYQTLLNCFKSDGIVKLMIISHHQKVTSHLTDKDSLHLMTRYCEYFLVLLEYKCVTEGDVLIEKILTWLLKNTDTDSDSVIYTLVKKLILTTEDNTDCVVKAVQSQLDSASSVPTLSSISSVSDVCCRLSQCLPDAFAEYFVMEAGRELDDMQLFKWLSIPAMKGQYIFRNTDFYINFTSADIKNACPAFVVHLIFAVDFLSKLSEESRHKPNSISSSLRMRIRAAHTWVSRLLTYVYTAESDWIVSQQSQDMLEAFVNDPETCLTDLNSICENGVDAEWVCLSLDNLVRFLPAVGVHSLKTLTDNCLSSYESLSQASLSCMNTAVYLLPPQYSAEFMDLVAARLVSLDSDEASEMSLRFVTSIIHLSYVTLVKTGRHGMNEQVVRGILDHIIEMKTKYPQQLICEKYPYMKEVDTDRLEYNVTVMRFFAHLMRTCPDILTGEQWDFVLLTLDGWVGDEKCILPSKLDRYSHQLYASNVGALLTTAGTLMKTTVTKNPGLFPKDFLAEWVELHALNIYNHLIPYYVNLASSIKKENLTQQLQFVIFAQPMIFCPPQSIKQHKLSVKLVPDHAHIIPANHETALNHMVPLLLSPSSAVQTACCVLLNMLMPLLPEHDNSPVSDDTEGRTPPVVLMSMLDHCGAQLLSIVGGARVGVDKPLHLTPYSEEICCVNGYLLTWKLLLKYLQYTTNEQMAEYSYHLKQNHYVSDLLLVLFNIIPLEEALPIDESKLLQLVSRDVCDGDEMIHLACWVYYNLVKVLPALVRSWHGELEKRANSLVDKFTSRYVSPRLSIDEMEQIQTDTSLISAENLTVRVRPAAREIVATYTLEEFSIELLIVLPTNYPVGLTNVECSKKLGVATSEWRKWMLQLTTFLTYQNGSVAKAIALWKRNLDKKFEGVEECYICFSVLHGTNLQLPKQQCRTCKKKFHSNCLYKWFTSSQKSTCPLCRNLF